MPNKASANLITVVLGSTKYGLACTVVVSSAASRCSGDQKTTAAFDFCCVTDLRKAAMTDSYLYIATHCYYHLQPYLIISST